VAARGLDLPDLGLVIHADLPQNRDTLVHRSGRTGRAGRKGLCVLLVPFGARKTAERLLKAANIEGKWAAPPSPDAIRQRDAERLVREIARLTETAADEDLAVARTLLAERTPEQLAAALVRLHRGLMPAPEELNEQEKEPAADRRRVPGGHRYRPGKGGSRPFGGKKKDKPKRRW
jgi:ATP-dependent RNA helicase DeaD